MPLNVVLGFGIDLQGENVGPGIMPGDIQGHSVGDSLAEVDLGGYQGCLVEDRFSQETAIRPNDAAPTAHDQPFRFIRDRLEQGQVQVG